MTLKIKYHSILVMENIQRDILRILWIVGRCATDDMVVHFHEFMKKAGLNPNFILRLGKDCPTVNLLQRCWKSIGRLHGLVYRRFLSKWRGSAKNSLRIFSRKCQTLLDLVLQRVFLLDSVCILHYVVPIKRCVL